ncbi:hypothetical protein EB796_003784 [Bugula neritina]|uniref:Uncharacterized protein n=1 Tax=Bugula neritina TaxID=10212 RepID=A0A7J7KI48_BUGNE|nr:hypothetical protein EB796_003784 [Bugula neritina]
MSEPGKYTVYYTFTLHVSEPSKYTVYYTFTLHVSEPSKYTKPEKRLPNIETGCLRPRTKKSSKETEASSKHSTASKTT